MEIEKTSMYNLKFSIMIANVIRGGSKPARRTIAQEYNILNGTKKLSGKKTGFSKKVSKQITRPRKLNTVGDAQNPEQYNDASRSILKVYNKDNICLIRAVLIAIAYDKKELNRKHLLRPSNKKIKVETNFIARLLSIPNKMCGIRELQKLEKHFNFQIMVIDDNYHSTNSPIYLNNNLKTYRCLYLHLSKDHYSVVMSMKRYLNFHYFCHLCKYAFDNLGYHKCDNVCNSCTRLNCNKDFELECKHCKIHARNYSCIKIHDEKRCKILRVCSVCGYYKHATRIHICGDNNKYCKNCKASVDLNHKCYMLTEEQIELRNKKKVEKKFNGFVFFDFETYVDDKSGNHVVNLAIAQKICINCLDLKFDERCDECRQTYVFYNITDYCNWCLKQKNTVQIAHNMQAYDGLFILKHFIESNIPTDRPVDVIRRGNNLLSIMFRTIKIIDSYNYIHSGLAEFPKTFGIKEF